MPTYPKFAPHELNIVCKHCGNFPLEIWAFEHSPTEAEPILVCTDCGNFNTPEEFGIKPEELLEKE
jgi:hypothetical protein